MDQADKPKFKTNLLWSILFLDLIIHSLRYGGLAMSDFYRHALLLALATLVLGLHRRVHAVPKPYLIIFGSVLAVALFQLVPLPDWLFPYLAPIKDRIVTATTAIYPGIAHTSEMTIVPTLHWNKLAQLVLDLYLVLLLFMSPRPSPNVFRGWLYLLGFIVGFLAILAGRDLLPDHGFLANYRDTFGGLINRNHFALFSVILMIFLWQQLLDSGRMILSITRSKDEPVEQSLLFHGFNAGLALSILIVVFAGFQFGWSRSGVILFTLGHVLFAGLVSLSRMGTSLRVLPKVLAVAGAAMVVILFLPLGAGLEKIYEQGLKDSKRLGYLKIGRDYLAEKQVLGTGLGSSESILEPVEIKVPEMTLNGRHFHNEYLQVLIEMGYPGLLALIALLLLITKDLIRDIGRHSDNTRDFIFAVLTAMILVVVHSLVAFPMMITSIKVFMVLAILLGIKTNQDQMPRTARKRWYFAAFLPFFAAAFAYFSYASSYVPRQGEDLPQVRRAVEYGYFYRIPMYVANEYIERFLVEQIDNEVILEQIPRIRPLLYKHLKLQPFSIKSLNLLFFLEVLEYRFNNPEFDSEQFLAFKEKAEAIRALGKDANIQAKSSLMFLLSFEKSNLNEEDAAELEALLDYAQWSLRRGNYELRQRKKQLVEESQDPP